MMCHSQCFKFIGHIPMVIGTLAVPGLSSPVRLGRSWPVGISRHSTRALTRGDGKPVRLAKRYFPCHLLAPALGIYYYIRSKCARCRPWALPEGTPFTEFCHPVDILEDPRKDGHGSCGAGQYRHCTVRWVSAMFGYNHARFIKMIDKLTKGISGLVRHCYIDCIDGMGKDAEVVGSCRRLAG